MGAGAALHTGENGIEAAEVPSLTSPAIVLPLGILCLEFSFSTKNDVSLHGWRQSSKQAGRKWHSRVGGGFGWTSRGHAQGGGL